MKQLINQIIKKEKKTFLSFQTGFYPEETQKRFYNDNMNIQETSGEVQCMLALYMWFKLKDISTHNQI